MTNDSRLPFTMLLPDDARLPIEIHDHSVALRLGVVERGGVNLLDESWDRPGAFILLGTVHSDGSFDVHVGSTPTGMRARLVVMENTRTWTRALLVQRDAQQGLTASHAGWLEGDLQELFRSSPKARLAPGQRVSDTSVASYYLPILASFREPITRVLRLLGFDPRPGTGRLTPAIPSLTAALPPGPSSNAPRPSTSSGPGSSSAPRPPLPHSMPRPSMPETGGPSTPRPGSPTGDPYRDYPGSATRPSPSYPPTTSRPAPTYAPAASAQPRDPRVGNDVLERLGADTPLAARVRAEHQGQLPAAPSRQIGSPHAPMSVPSFQSSDSGSARPTGGNATRSSSAPGSQGYTGAYPTSYSPSQSGSSGSSYPGGSSSGSSYPGGGSSGSSYSGGGSSGSSYSGGSGSYSGGSGTTSSYGSGSGPASGSTYPPRPSSPAYGGGPGSSHGSGSGSSYSPSGLRPASYTGPSPTGGSGSGSGQSGPGNALAPRPSMPLLRFGRESSPIFDAMRSPEERRR